MYQFKAKFKNVETANHIVLDIDLGFYKTLEVEVILFDPRIAPNSEDAKLFVELWFAINDDVNVSTYKCQNRWLAHIFPYHNGCASILGKSLQEDMLEAGLVNGNRTTVYSRWDRMLPNCS